jgi:hypothetical protein
MATHVVRDTYIRPHRVVLAPGQKAATVMHWSVIQGIGDQTGPCVTPPTRVEVTPPDAYTHLTIRWNHTTVCERGRVDVTPLKRVG